MPAAVFNRDAHAKWYAKRHAKLDRGVRRIVFLPDGAGDREIRMLEVNDQLIDQAVSALDPLDLAVESTGPDGHTLYVLDVTPNQWERIVAGKLALPSTWSLNGMKVLWAAD
jgi:hypothetical protein